MRLPHLKKCDLRGCLVKIDDPASQLQSRHGKRVEIDSDYVRNVKKKALGRNYQRVKWQDSPDSSDNEETHR